MNPREFVARVCLLLTCLVPLSAQSPAPNRPQIVQSALPISFEPTSTQGDDSVSMIAHTPDITLGFRPAAIVVGFSGKNAGTVQIEFDGARPTIPTGQEIQKSQTNYLIGDNPASWRTHVPNYAKVAYLGLYPGIDAIFYGVGHRLEYDMVVKAGADYRQIRMHFPKGTRPLFGKDGELTLKLPEGSLRLRAPYIYQDEDGKRCQRSGSFRRLPGGDIAFSVAAYDHSRDLVIDPVLVLESYVASAEGSAVSVATDADGNTYTTGYTTVSFPVTAGAFTSCGQCNINSVVTFITKLSANGSNPIYSTYLGGNEYAQPTGIAADANGDAIVTGLTVATNFPTKGGQPTLPPDNNTVGFLVSLSPDGSSLNYGTLISVGPSATNNIDSFANAVAADASGNAYVTGTTGPGFVVTPDALNQQVPSTTGGLVYLAKFSPSGSLIYSAILGPGKSTATAVDAAGDAYVAGETIAGDWPVTSGAYHASAPDGTASFASFLIKVSPDGQSAIYSTFLDTAVFSGISVLPNGNVFLVGNDALEPGNTLGSPAYPTTPDAFAQHCGPMYNGLYDVDAPSVLTELNSTGSALVYSTMVCVLGASGIAIDSVSGEIWLAESATYPPFPLVASISPVSEGNPCTGCPALSVFDPTGRTLVFSTILGQSGGGLKGFASGVALDSHHRAHISGGAEAGLYLVPPNPNLGPLTSSYMYPFVAIVDPAGPGAALCFTPDAVVNFGAIGILSTLSASVTVTSCGNQPLSIANVTAASSDFALSQVGDTCEPNLAVGQSCTFNVQFTPSALGPVTSSLKISSNATTPSFVGLNGTGLPEPVITLSPTSLNFSPQLAGSESDSRTVTVTNTGALGLSGLAVELPAPSQSVFPIVNSCGTSLDSGSSCTFTVAFKPAIYGTTNATLSVLNDYAPSNQSVKLSATSPPFIIGVQAGGSATATVSSGNPASYSLVATPSSGYSGTLVFACSSNNLPAYASCSFSPDSLSLAGRIPANFTVTIATQTTQTAGRVRFSNWGTVLATCFVIVPFSLRRKRVARWLSLFFLFSLIAGVSACGSGGTGGSNTPPQTFKVAPGVYTIGITISDGASHLVGQSLTLNVQ